MHEPLSMARMAQNAQDARRAGDDRTAAYWDEMVEAANLRELRTEWDCLKGSPEHG